MARLESKVDTGSESYAENRAAMLAAIDGMRALEAAVRANSERARPRFEARGQLLPRERLERLLDRGAPFLELSTLCAYRTFDDDGEENISGGRVITGIGRIRGVACVIVCFDAGIKAGSLHPHGVDKLLRAHELALENKLPFVQLVESAGADLLQYEPVTFIKGGGIFYNMARLSAAGCPVVSVVHGSSTAGGAYMPGMSDYVVMVRGRAKAFLAGPPLVKAATGEEADDETLGGVDMHATTTGLVEYVADDDAEAVDLGREVVARLNWDAGPEPRSGPPPAYDIDELCGVVPLDYARPYDVREVIARLVDGSEFLDFKPLFDAQTVCGHAAVEGYPCGFIGNNGPITPAGAVKAAQFIQLCCQSATPLVFLQNTTGYVVGSEPEQAGIIKHGSKMIQAVANAEVPRITLMIGASFGAGNYGMAGHAYRPRFCFGWPNYRIAVMGGAQAALVMAIVQEARAKRRGEALDEAALEDLKERVKAQYDSKSSALYATARLWDDGLIDPRDSRRVLGLTLGLADAAAARTLRPNSFGVARF